MVPQCHKTLDPSLLVLSGCISTRSIRLLACQRFGQEHIEESITRKYRIHIAEFFQTCTHKLVLELSSAGEFLDFVSNAQRAPLEELQCGHAVAMPLRGIRNQPYGGNDGPK